MQQPLKLWRNAQLATCDATSRRLARGALLTLGARIEWVGEEAALPPATPEEVHDLGGAWVTPGLIDCHTHIMARIPNGPDGYTLNLATKSQAFRALEGAYDARITLRSGFTTVRDVENEGSGYADVLVQIFAFCSPYGRPVKTGGGTPLFLKWRGGEQEEAKQVC